MRNSLFFTGILFFATNCFTFAQEKTTQKQVLLHEITVHAARQSFYNDTKQVFRIDSSDLAQNSGNSLSELLEKSSSLNIKSYGSTGSLTSISIRGTSAVHTSINWNGLPINSLTSGDVDLSLIPTYANQTVEIIPNASGTTYGSGTFGGAIDISNRASWKKQTLISFSEKMGSFSYFNHLLSLQTGNNWIHYQAIINKLNAANDFEFVDTDKFGAPTDTLFHNSIENFIFIQNLFIKFPKNNRLEIGTWLQFKQKQIPSQMGSYAESNKNQKDSTSKAYLKYQKTFSSSKIEFKTAYMSDFIHYTDKLNAKDNHFYINSKIQTSRWLNEINFRHYATNSFILDAALLYNYLEANVSAYNKNVTEKNASVIIGTKINIRKINITSSIRQNWDWIKKTTPLFSIGIKTNLIENKLIFSCNLANKYRKPTFNERYWIPGGNPNILPENGWGSDLNMTFKPYESLTKILKFNISLYTNRINNQIKWIPDNGVWRPINYEKVWTRGTEFNTYLKIKINKLNIIQTNTSQYTLASKQESLLSDDLTIGNQLSYIPKHVFNSKLNIKYANINFVINHKYTGSRFTTDSNMESQKLESYHITNLYNSFFIINKNREYNIAFEVNNIFNHFFQTIRSYPAMPRTFYIHLRINLNINKVSSTKF